MILDNSTEDKCIGAWYFKDLEFDQIKKYFEGTRQERLEKINPLSDKLLIYLLNDVCRMNPEAIFQDDYLTMPSIREAMINGIGLRDILRIDWTEIDKDQKRWEDAQKNSDQISNVDDNLDSEDATKTEESSETVPKGELSSTKDE